MICKECQDRFILYFCDKCKSVCVNACRECHNELAHEVIKYHAGRPAHGGTLKSSPYCEEDAQYFPGICDKFRNA